MGLYLAPFILQTVLKSLLVRYLYCIWIHLDDLLVFGRSREELVSLRAKIVQLLREVGFMINVTKSVLWPVAVYYLLRSSDTGQNFQPCTGQTSDSP